MGITRIPPLGLGTGGDSYPDGDELANAVRTALEIGYRHVDTAQMYGNQPAIARGMAASDVPREEIFLTSKVSPGDLDYDGVKRSARHSLERLDVERLDLLYVHFPTGAYDPAETFAAFDDLREEGAIDAVGVSNFTPAQVAEAREYADSPIVADQVEMHPWCQQEELLQYARETDLAVVAYCPLIRGRVFDDPVVRDVASERDVSPAQVSLAWLLEKDVRVIAKSTSPAHLRDNFAALELELDAEAVARIDAIERTEKLVDTTQT